MNDRSSGGMTVSRLMIIGLVFSIAIPVVLILALGVFERVTNDANVFELVVGLCALAVLVGVFTVNYLVRRRIEDHLLSLVAVCRSYGGGERGVRATVTGDDAFAMLSMSLNTLLDNQGVASNAGTVANLGSDAAALQAQIEKLLQEVSAVGDGDLSVQAEVTPDTLGVLADSFNYMIEELAKIVGRVQTTAVQITHATRRILDRSAELAQASEREVEQISQTSQAVEDLVIFIQNVARNAKLSAAVAQEALASANTGQQAVRQTIDGMMLIRENVQETQKKIKRLGERSNEISEIVRIIEDIADQTNLLALNAAIQSAMAGEHGRGFAVVADEIRLLAERSTESTRRIETLVKSIQGDTFEAVVAMEDSTQEVVKGSQLADDAGRALNSIYAAVERQAQMIESIARAANEQTPVSESVAIAMDQISEITHQANAGTQEATASVNYLSELADQLRASVSTFRLPEHSSGMVEVFPDMMAVPALSGANADQVYSSEADWNAGFSGDFLPFMPSNGEAAHQGAQGVPLQVGSQDMDLIEFDFGNGQDFANAPAFGNQQGFGIGRQFGQSGFSEQQFSFDESGEFDNPAGFNRQQFGNAPGFAASGQSVFPTTSNQPPIGQQNFGSTQAQGMNEHSPLSRNRQRWTNSQQNASQPSFGQNRQSQDQNPFYEDGNG